MADAVEVSGAAELVQTSTSGNFGSLVEQRVLSDLPIVGTRDRSPMDLVYTQPGVVLTDGTTLETELVAVEAEQRFRVEGVQHDVIQPHDLHATEATSGER